MLVGPKNLLNKTISPIGSNDPSTIDESGTAFFHLNLKEGVSVGSGEAACYQSTSLDEAQIIRYSSLTAAH